MRPRMDRSREKESRRGIRGHLHRLWKDSHGQDLVEYALLLVLLCTAAVATLDPFACQLSCVFEVTAQSIEKMRGNLPPGQIIKCTRQCS